jgi:hypothetical protein
MGQPQFSAHFPKLSGYEAIRRLGIGAPTTGAGGSRAVERVDRLFSAFV